MQMDFFKLLKSAARIFGNQNSLQSAPRNNVIEVFVGEIPNLNSAGKMLLTVESKVPGFEA